MESDVHQRFIRVLDEKNNMITKHTSNKNSTYRKYHINLLNKYYEKENLSLSREY
jgi:hypothetical protein